MTDWNTGYVNYKLTADLSREEWQAEIARWDSLTPEQQKAEYEAGKAERDAKWAEEYRKEKEAKEERSRKDAEHTYIYSDSVNTLENVEATIIWLVVMGIGLIFKARWLIWIIATTIYLRHIFRYDIRKAQWDKEHNNGGNNDE